MGSEILSYNDRAGTTHYLPLEVCFAECHACGIACATNVKGLPRIAWSLAELAGYVPCDRVQGHKRPICRKCNRQKAKQKFK